MKHIAVMLFALSLLEVVKSTETEDSGEEISSITDDDDVIVLTSANFEETIQSSVPVLVEFYAPWCGHCKALAPEYAEAARTLNSEGIRLAKVDATEEQDLASRYDVSGYPALKLFKDGEVMEDYTGGRTAEAITDFMRKVTDPSYQPPSSAVLILTAENFTEVTNSKEIMVVEFYAPWCGHCKRLAPQYEEAAKELKQDDIPLAKVDGTAQKELAEKYSVTGYPTIFIFRNGRKFDYKGPREKHGIVSYMREQAKPPSKEVSTVTEVRNLITHVDAAVFGFFEKDSMEYEAYLDAGHELRGDIVLMHTYDPHLANKHQLKLGHKLELGSIHIVMPEIYHSRYEESVKTLSLSGQAGPTVAEWITSNSVPLLGQRTRQNVGKVYKNRPLLVVYFDVNFSHQYVKDTQYVRSKILPLAHQNRDIVFAISNEEEFEDELKNLGLAESGENVNVALFTDSLKYAMEPDEDFEEAIDEFIIKFKNGKLKPSIKSQPIPAKQEGPVKSVVARNFEKEIMSCDKDVLIEFYAPWCGHCKKLEPVYKKLAKSLNRDYPDILVAKMDATANDVSAPFTVSGFPTIYFLPRADKENPVLYEGEHSLEKLKSFVLEHKTVHQFSAKEDL